MFFDDNKGNKVSTENAAEEKNQGYMPEQENQAAEHEQAAAAPDQRDRYEPTVAEEIRTLILKIVYVLVAFFVIFTFIFGLHRNLSAGMQPSLRDGDLLFYYRLDRDFRANNVVVFEYKDELIASRVIAVEGDTVNITDRGLEINGHTIYEPEIYSKTTQFKDGPTFPLTVEPGTVFVLGDNREHANDSRIIGLIKMKDIKGKVMGIIRRRNL
jgi:signal peptidase I